MADLIHLEIVTPSKIFFEGGVKSLSAPGYEGSFQVLPRHAPYITTLVPGKVKVVMQDQKELIYAISGGTVEVHANRITMLADSVIPQNEIDTAEAEAEKTEAENQLKAKEPGMDKDALMLKLNTAKAKLKAVNS